ncbi:MAG: EAL domain-containing protein, partial [Campylobacterales bacterium]|nr:EAL domain-containing protein [Campylobacterales bacterium]
MLKNKLFLHIGLVITIVLLVNGLIYYKNVNDIFDVQVKTDIDSDQKEVANYFIKLKDNLFRLSAEIISNDELKSSMNLISFYEDPNDYVKETFDYEKRSLVELSKKWIKDSSHYSLEFFDTGMNLVAVNRVFDEAKVIGYRSYDADAQKKFIDYTRLKESAEPSLIALDKKDLQNFKLDFSQDRVLISYLNTVYLDDLLVGYVRIITCIDQQKLKSINDAINLPLVLYTNQDIYLFPSEDIKNRFSDIKVSNNYRLISKDIFDDKKFLKALFIVDKTVVNERMDEILIQLVELWIIILIVAFLVSAYFVNRSVLTHIDDMKAIIEDIKNGKFKQSVKIEKNNELSMIVNDFYDLSAELHKNIAFLKSYELAMDESSIVSKSDLSGKITFVNDNFCKISGYTKDEVIGKSHNIVRHEDNSPEIFKDMWETIKDKKVWKGVIKNKGKLDDYWIDVVAIPILDENDDIVEYMAVRHDITEVINQKEKLDSIANTDALTGLGNRYKINNDIKGSICPALAIINIDNFSQLNDFYGEENGDFIIKEFGKKLQESLDERDCSFYHIQGDEYAVFNQNIGKDEFMKNLIFIKSKISNSTIKIGDEDITFNFTTGVSFESKDKIFITADMALKVAKRQNNDLIVYSDDVSLNDEYENNIKWTKKIIEAIQNDKIVPVFQPIVNNQTGKWEKYESLVRIDDGDRLISPFFFLEISKKTKHYTQITKIMIEKTFEEFKDKKLEFSINLTVEDILNQKIKDFIFEMLSRYNIGDRVVFEIVESESIENFDDVLNFIDMIREYGCKIAIDDFGTGYSNFEYLLKLKTDYV